MATKTKDPALDAIQELDDSVRGSFEILEKQGKELAERQDAQEATVKTLARQKWEMDQQMRMAQGSRYRYSGSSLLHAFDERTREYARVLEVKGGDEEKGGFRDPMFSAAAAQWFLSSMNWQRSRGGDVEALKTRERLTRAFNDIDGVQTAAALTTGTPSLGGDWIPDPVEKELRRLVLDNSILSPLVTHVPMNTKTLDLPIEGTSALTVSWITEGSSITDSIPASNALGKLTMTANKIAGYGVASLEAIFDSPVSILDWVNNKLSELIARELDKQALEGTGSPFTGLSNDAGVLTIAAGTNGDAIDYTKLSKIPYTAVEQASRSGARFFMSPGAMAKIVGLMDTANAPIFRFGAVSDAIPGTLFGYPVHVHSAISSARTKGSGTTLTNIYFGPPKQIVFGDRLGMAWDTSDAPGFQTAQIAMRLIMREAIAIAVPKAFTNAKDLIT